MRLLILFLCTLLWPAVLQAQEGLRLDRQSAVILVYNRVGEDSYPATNIRVDQFAAHLKTLKDGGYRVVPLARIIDALRQGNDIPDKTIALTFDGGHRSILENAVPLLHDYAFPYTLFMPGHAPDAQDESIIHWAEAKKLEQSGLAAIGLQSAFYAHLAETDETAIRRHINNSRAAYRQAMGHEPDFYAYPFGEMSQAYRDFIETQGFSAAFGQHSGAVSPAADFYALPRFSLTESYADLERFETVIDALPLPVDGLEPADPHLSTNRPAIGFTLPPALAGRDDFSCFASGAEDPDIVPLSQGRVELRFAGPLDTDRLRINCTLSQGTDDPEKPYRWRWLGLLFTFKHENARAPAFEE